MTLPVSLGGIDEASPDAVSFRGSPAESFMTLPVSLGGIDEASPDEAYARVLSEAMSLPSNKVRRLNLDVENVVIIALAAAKRLPSFEGELRGLQGFPAEHLDHLADYILALRKAHLHCCFATRPVEKLPELNEAAIRWRDILLAEAKSLALRDHIQAEQLKKFVTNQGYRRVARDLSGLAQIFKENWERIKDDSGLKHAHVLEAEKLALKLTCAIALRAPSPEQILLAREIRARIFTLLCRAYEQIRRGIRYIRWQGDTVDEIIPSLYSGRKRAKANQESPDASTEPTEAQFVDSSSSPVTSLEETNHVASENAERGPLLPPGMDTWAPTSNGLIPPQLAPFVPPRAATEAKLPPTSQEPWHRTAKKVRSPLASYRRRATKTRASPFS
ncbi:MAG: hypothetical protein QM784_22315 [Polyangiaceae bacterium]